MVFTEHNYLHQSQIDLSLLHLGNINPPEICQYKRGNSKANSFCSSKKELMIVFNLSEEITVMVKMILRHFQIVHEGLTKLKHLILCKMVLCATVV